MGAIRTFSIVGADPGARELGVAVASKFLSVGAVVPWAEAEVGAIATQSWANTSYGPKAMRLLRRGLSAAQALDRLVSQDSGRGQRQAGIVDSMGNAATFTGGECFPWAGGLTGPNFACQGNILVGETAVRAMANAFQSTGGDLADRLLRALMAGDAAGGDSRGKQSAALVVVKPKGGYGGWNDRFVDLRVDDHRDPVAELVRLMSLHRLYLYKTDPKDLVQIDVRIARELQSVLTRHGYYHGPLHGQYDVATRQALRALVHRENLEERERSDDMIDGVVLQFIRQRFGDQEAR